MNSKRITFIGSSSENSPRSAQNGDCLRTVNLRRRNNSLTSIGNNPIHCVLADAERLLIYVHDCNERQHLISIKEHTLYHEADISTSDKKTTAIDRELITLDDDMSSITSLGNTLIVTTSSATYYMLHQDAGYKILGQQPPMPIIRFHEIAKGNESSYIEATTFPGEMKISATNNINTFTDLVLGAFYKIRDKAYEKFHFIQPSMIRYALRLYDGSRIYPSAPILLHGAAYREIACNRTVGFTYDDTSDTSTMEAFLLNIATYGIEYTIDTCNLQEWSDIICGIDFFISREAGLIEDRRIDDGIFQTEEENRKTYRYTLPCIKREDLEQEVRNQSLFYKLASIDLEEIKTGVTREIVHDIRPDNIIYQPMLETDTACFASIGANKSYVHNGRLHLADISRRRYEGYPATLFAHIYNTNHGNAPAYIRTIIKELNGSTKEVVSYNTIPGFDSKLSPLLSYPDAHTVSMEIVIRYDGYEYRKTFNLTSVDNENRASYIHPYLEDINVTDWNKTAITTDNIDNFPTQSSSYSRRTHNEMIVSQPLNPFIFTSDLSYTVSNGTIAGMASTTTALSQGQYGEFPLYVFTDQGIWGMQIGEGNVCYARCTLINNAGIDKEMPVAPAVSNIIYRSGCYLASIDGSTCKTLLSLAQSKQENFINQIPGLLKESNLSHTDNTALIDYFGDKISVGCLHRHNELIFCNPAYCYCIVLHLPSGHLYRMDKPIRNLIQSNDKLLAQSYNNAIYDLSREIDATSVICLITEALQPLPDTYTRLRQIMLRMSCSHADIAIRIIASHEPDGTYGVIYKATYNGTIAGHLPLKICAPPYKYYRIIINGSVSHDFTLDCADLAFEPQKTDKLR